MHCTLCNKRDYCGTGQQTIFLDADGSLYPCPNHCYNQFKFGNIFNHGYNLIDLWEKSPILDKLRKQYNIHDLNETCSTCIVRNWCTGGCRGESFAVTGKLDAPAPDCNESRDAIIEMMWILGEHPFLKPFKAKEEHF
jgi:radical SAM protein with 4Fe4S-binding SPASM domain